MLSEIEVTSGSFDGIVSRNEHVQAAKRQAQQAALLGSHMLIIGEQGTEKEQFAAAVHAASARASASFVELDCFYLSGTLIEEMLFGRQVEKELQPLMRSCAEGTLFIQQVGALPLIAQSRIVHACQTGRLALDSGDELDFRCKLIATSTDDLTPAVEDRQFRSDLHRMLDQTVIWLPPLRHRKEDVPLLVHKLINELRASLGKPLNSISDEAMNALVHYPWPGNVRELKTVIGRCAMLAKGEMILLDHLPKSIQRARKIKNMPVQDEDSFSLAIVEKRHIQKVLDYTGWHKVRSARILGIDRSTLYDKIRRYNLINPADRVAEPAAI